MQWHYEDIIRDPNIDPVDALVLKRKIDASNQDRTDMVEYIDSYFLEDNKSQLQAKDLTQLSILKAQLGELIDYLFWL